MPRRPLRQPPIASQPSAAADGSPTDPAAERQARRGGGAESLWNGCPLVTVDQPIRVPEGAEIGLKVELTGWPDMGEIPKYRTKSRVPVDVLRNLDLTRDDLHRMYGAGVFFIHAYLLNEKGQLSKPLKGQTHECEPCEFDDPSDSDPDEPEDDVGAEVWSIGSSWLNQDATLSRELKRRNLVRKEMMRDDRDAGRGRFDDEEDDYGRPRRREPERDWGSRGRDWGRDERDPFRHAFDPQPVIAPTTPPVEEKKPTFIELMERAAAIAAVVGPVFVPLLTQKRESPVEMMVAMMAAMNGSKGDPVVLKQLEIEAEARREAREAVVRASNERAAAEQRAHELRLAAEQRAAEAKIAAEKIAAEQRAAEVARQDALDREERQRRVAREEQDRIIALKQAGLIQPDGPTPAQREAEFQARLEMEKLRLQMAQLASQKNPDAVSQLEAAKKLITSLGGKVGGDDDPGGFLVELLHSPTGAQIVQSLSPILERLLTPKPVGNPEHPPQQIAPVFVQQPQQIQQPQLPTPEQQEYLRQQHAFALQQQYEAQRAFEMQQQQAAQALAPTWENQPQVEPAPALAPVPVEPDPVPLEQPVEPSAEPATPPDVVEDQSPADDAVEYGDDTIDSADETEQDEQ